MKKVFILVVVCILCLSCCMQAQDRISLQDIDRAEYYIPTIDSLFFELMGEVDLDSAYLAHKVVEFLEIKTLLAKGDHFDALIIKEIDRALGALLIVQAKWDKPFRPDFWLALKNIRALKKELRNTRRAILESNKDSKKPPD